MMHTIIFITQNKIERWLLLMKKFIITFLVSLCLLFNMNILNTSAQTKVYKEGFYRTEDLNLSPNDVHVVQNNSFIERAYILIFDSNQILQQSIRLKPQSPKFDLVPLEPGYKIVIVGDGEISIS